MTLFERLTARIAIGDPDQCWHWTGRRDPSGYGRLDVDGRPQLAHRLMLRAVGRDPGVLMACHSCDEPSCCNPNHLFVGTQAENLADMTSKGRRVSPAIRRGSDVNTSRLTEEQALEVMRSKETAASLARKFGVSKNAVRLIRIGKNWAHLPRACA